MSSLPAESTSVKTNKEQDNPNILPSQADSNRPLKEPANQDNFIQATLKDNPKLNESNIDLEGNKEKEKEKLKKLTAKRLASIDTYLNWGLFTGWCVTIYCLFVWWVGLIGLAICAAMLTAIRSIAFKVVAKYSADLWRKYNIPILIMSIICFTWYGVVFIYLLVDLIRQSNYNGSYSLTNVFSTKLKVFYPMITSVIGIYLVLAPTFILQLLAIRNYKKLPQVFIKDELDKQ